MLRPRVLLGLIIIVATFAGCAGNEATSTPPSESVNGSTTTTTTPTVGGTGTIPTNDDDDSGTTDDDAVPWGAYRFDETVQPRSGGAGKIESYAYQHTEEQDGKITILDVNVEFLGVSTENIRGQTLDFSTGATSVVTAPVEVAKLRHTLSVTRDDSEELTVGDRGVATIWIPTTKSSSTAASLWQFVHIDFESDGSTSVWESLPVEAGQTALSIPFTEGDDATSWWGFNHLVTTYALSWWAVLFEDALIEEGSHGFGGFQYSANRETLTVGNYGFNGWRVAWSATVGTDSGAYNIAVAPGLPIPFESSFSSTTTDGTDRISYKLTELRLG